MITCKALDGVAEQNPITRWRSIALSDMSLSNWQYILAYGTSNGSVHCSEPLRNPTNYNKKYSNFVSII